MLCDSQAIINCCSAVCNLAKHHRCSILCVTAKRKERREAIWKTRKETRKDVRFCMFHFLYFVLISYFLYFFLFCRFSYFLYFLFPSFLRSDWSENRYIGNIPGHRPFRLIEIHLYNEAVRLRRDNTKEIRKEKQGKSQITPIVGLTERLQFYYNEVVW